MGVNATDDAGVFRLREDLAIVCTVDFFTPIVDDPFTFGQIAAANAVSDVYAMGGIPCTALNIVCWPQAGLPNEMLAQILRGGADKAAEAGMVVVGGHSVGNDEVKYGMAVTGLIDPHRIVRNVGARVGDLLLLTKPLGTGVLMTALKRDALAQDHYGAAVKAMVELNARASELMLKHGAHAATDITGFGLVGHAMPMAEGSGVTMRFEESDLPLLPGAIEAARAGMNSGGCKRNREFFAPRVEVSDEVADEIVELVFDPQTSGGLLIALAPESAYAMLAELQGEGNLDAQIVGRILPKGAHPIEIV